MKIFLVANISVLLLFPSLSWTTDISTYHNVDNCMKTNYCSTDYLNLELQIDIAYDLMLTSDIDQSRQLYLSIENSLDQADIPIKEKIRLANRISQGYYDRYDFEIGNVFAQKYLDIAKESLTQYDYELAKAYELMGAFQIVTKEFKSSFENLNQALEILESYGQEFLIYFHLGELYQQVDQFEKSIDLFKMAVDNINQEDKSIQNIRHHFLVYSAYYYTLVFFQDFAKAHQYIQKMEALSQQTTDPILNFVVDLYNAYYFISLDEPDTAWTYLDQELPNHPFIDIYTSDYYDFRGLVAHGLGNYDKAIEMYQISLENEIATGNDMEKLATIYYDMGLTYLDNNQPDKALEAYNNALCSFENLIGNYSSTLEEIGWLYYSEKALELAKNYFNEAFNLQDENTAGKITAVEGIISVHLEYFKERQEQNHVDSILHYMNIQDKLLTQLRMEHRYFSDQSLVEYNTYVSYTFNLDILKELFHSCQHCNLLFDKLFQYIEGVKAYSVRENIKAQKGLHTFGVLDELIEKIKQEKKAVKNLEDNIYKLEHSISDSKTKEATTEEINNTRQQLYAAIEDYNSTLLSIETKYPSYFNYKYNNNLVGIKDIQKILEPHEALIEYFTSDSTIFMISIEHDTVHYVNKKKSEDWTKIIEDYTDSVTKIEYQHQDSTSITFSKFTSSSHKLYRILLKDALDLLDEDVTHLTIVPDEQIHFIQYDNLLTTEVIAKQKYKELDFLINDYTISRSASAFIYSSLKNKARQKKKYKYVGFAPKYYNTNITIIDSLEAERIERAEYLNDLVTRGDFSDLPYARESVKSITSILSGISFIGTEATRETFLTRSHKASIIHFAGHAIVDPDPKFSQLLFSHESIDSQVYASDIYNMDLDIDLVVLSACNTGNGISRNGEGVMSLSRAFKFAGCSSLVMSLWNIPDVQTAKVEYSFFENLDKGERIDDALRLSKLDYLKVATDQTAHPLFWSGLTASGNMDAIKSPSTWDRFCRFF